MTKPNKFKVLALAETEDHQFCRFPIISNRGFMPGTYKHDAVGSQWQFYKTKPGKIQERWPESALLSQRTSTWMLLGGVVSKLSNGPNWASSGLLLALIRDTKWTCQVN